MYFAINTCPTVAQKTDDGPEPNQKQLKDAKPLLEKLKELEAKRIKCYDKLRSLFDSYCWDFLEGESMAFLGYYSSDEYLSAEEFTPDEVAELNSKGILTATQHRIAAGCKTHTRFHLTLTRFYLAVS